MSYILADSTGELCEFATTQELGSFLAWGQTQSAPIRRFVHFGFTEDVKLLVEALKAASAPEAVQEQKALLQEYAERARDIIIMSDGTSEDEPRTTSSSENAVHTAADASYKKLLVAVQYAFARGRDAVNTSALRSATSHTEADAAMAKAPGAVRAALLETLPHVLVRCVDAGGAAGFELLRQHRALLEPRAAAKQTSFEAKFDVANPEVAKWARKRVAKLLTDLPKTTQHDIAEAIATAAETGSWKAAYDTILSAVGDDTRAKIIARTETMAAANEGQRQSWDQAVEQGLLTGEEQREWISSTGCCDDCDELNGQMADLGGEYPADGGDGPPLHPNCRCTEGIVLRS